MSLALRDRNRYTYGDYSTWNGDARWELIDGLAYAMAPAPTRTHQIIVGEIFRQIANQLQGQACRAFIAPFDVLLPRGNEPDDAVESVVQPDGIVVSDPKKLDEKGCRGAPDWIVEVLSPSTADHDHKLKRVLYERSGVLEYWLVHPTDRLVHVYCLANGQYGKPDVFVFSDVVATRVAGGLTVDFAQVARALD